MTRGRLQPPDVGGEPTFSNDPALEALCGKVDVLESMLTELSGRRFVVLEEKLDGLRDLLSRRRKDSFTVEEIAELTGRSAYTIRRWIALGKLKASRIAEGGPRG